LAKTHSCPCVACGLIGQGDTRQWKPEPDKLT